MTGGMDVMRKHRSRAGMWRIGALAVSAFIFAAGLGYSPRAFAYNGTEHIRFPDQAHQILNIMRRGGFYADQAKRITPSGTFAPLTVRPPGVPASSDAAWQSFVAQALAAPARLDNVMVGLSNPPRSSQDCGGVFANLPSGAQFAQCRARDLGFAPRRGWADNPNECYRRRGYQFGAAGNDSQIVIPFFQELPTNYTGALLGLWATRPDDESNDTAVFIRPTNIVLLGDLKRLAEDAVELGLVVVLAPLFCITDFLFTGDPTGCIDDAAAASHSFDPVARADDYLLLLEEALGPVLDPVGNFMLFGKSNPASMFHFIVPSRSGDFNFIPGMNLGESRLGIENDSVDEVLTAYFDLIGLTVNPADSTGPSRYGQFAAGPLGRNDSDWAGFSMAHVEFEPVDNVARYGWQQFQQTGTARGLGWVLHALGDAFCPHHTLGSLGWGHQPWERFAGVRWVAGDVFPEDLVQVQYPNMVTELTYAFQYWTMANQFPQNDWPGRLVEQVGIETASSPFAVKGRAFKGTISVLWSVGSDSDSDATDAYDSERGSYKDLMMRAVGASIAFLAKASTAAPVGGSSPCACPAGQARSGEDINGRPVQTPGGICVTCGTGGFAQEPNLLDGQCVAVCPPDKPTPSGGVCTTTGACPTATPFLKNGSCVAACCPFDSTCPVSAPITGGGHGIGDELRTDEGQGRRSRRFPFVLLIVDGRVHGERPRLRIVRSRDGIVIIERWRHFGNRRAHVPVRGVGAVVGIEAEANVRLQLHDHVEQAHPQLVPRGVGVVGAEGIHVRRAETRVHAGRAVDEQVDGGDLGLELDLVLHAGGRVGVGRLLGRARLPPRAGDDHAPGRTGVAAKTSDDDPTSAARAGAGWLIDARRAAHGEQRHEHSPRPEKPSGGTASNEAIHKHLQKLLTISRRNFHATARFAR